MDAGNRDADLNRGASATSDWSSEAMAQLDEGQALTDFIYELTREDRAPDLAAAAQASHQPGERRLIWGKSRPARAGAGLAQGGLGPGKVLGDEGMIDALEAPAKFPVSGRAGCVLNDRLKPGPIDL